MVALSVAAFAFFPIITMIRTGMKTNIQQSHWSQARELAQKTMDEILALHYEEITLSKNNIKYGSVSFPRKTSIKNTEFIIEVNVAEHSPSFTFRSSNLLGDIIPPIGQTPKIYKTTNELKEIDVEVSWQGISRRLIFPLKCYKADLFK